MENYQVENWMVEEWNLFQAARWMGVKPWELLEKPAYWLERGRFYMSVDAGMQKGVKIQKRR